MKLLAIISILFASCLYNVPSPKGFTDVVRAEDINEESGSFCLEGLTRILGKYHHCEFIAYKKINENVTKYVCADEGVETSKDNILLWEYFVIQIDPKTGQYARGNYGKSSLICMDPKTMIAASKRTKG